MTPSAHARTQGRFRNEEDRLAALEFALEGMSEALAMEAATFGVKLSIVQPGGYWTDLYTSMTSTTPSAEYGPLRAELERQWAEGSIDSEPRLAAEALLGPKRPCRESAARASRG